MSWEFDGVSHRKLLRDSPFHKAIYDELQTISRVAGIAAQQLTQDGGGKVVASSLIDIKTAYARIKDLFDEANTARMGIPGWLRTRVLRGEEVSRNE